MNNIVRNLELIVTDRDRWKREAIAARNIIHWDGAYIGSSDADVRKQEADTYHAARAANTPERTTQHAE